MACICDIDPAGLAAAADALPGVATVPDADAVFAADGIDAVCIATLSDAKPALIRAALAAGKHLIVEKPIAADAAAEQELLDQIEASDRLVAVNLFNRNAWYHKQAHAFIAAGEIGTLGIVRVAHLTAGLMPGTAHLPEGPPFHDCGMHYVDLARWYAGSEYDQVNVAGQVTLSGTLAVSLIDSFAPAAGDAFAVLTYGSRSSEFASITGWEHDELAHLAFYGANDLTLHCTYFGDATLEGCVDGADYTAWADNYHTSDNWQGGDFNCDGYIDGADYTAWADNYGNCGSGNAIPEPAALTLLALGGPALLRGKRRPSR